MTPKTPSKLRAALVAVAEALADHLEGEAAQSAPRPRQRPAPAVEATDIERAFARKVLKQKGIPVPERKAR